MATKARFEASKSAGKGVEYATSGRCEIWLRDGGIEASNVAVGHECWRYVDPNGGSHLPNVTTTLLPLCYYDVIRIIYYVLYVLLCILIGISMYLFLLPTSLL